MAAHFVLVTLAASLAPNAAIADRLFDAAERDVAYEELRAGETTAAIRHLEQALENNGDDPAGLINLGTAYARDGRYEDAERMFRAAMSSQERQWLEVADGSWRDSHELARLGLARLEQNRSLALR